MTGPVVKALVLAAGKSTRISSVAGNLPKPLIEIAGACVLAHNLKLLASHGIIEVFINLHYKPELIRREIGDGGKWGVSVKYSQESDILGTSGAVKKLSVQLGTGTFLVLYGDNYTDCNLTELLEKHRNSGSASTIAVFDHTKNRNSKIAGGRVVLGEGDAVESFTEGNVQGAAKSDYVNAGVYALDAKVISYIPDGFSDFGKDIFPLLLSKKEKISAYKISGFCLAVDTPEAYAEAVKISAHD